jgi:sulfotransferase family protein
LASVEVLRITMAAESPGLSGFWIDAPPETAEQGPLRGHPGVDPARALANWPGSQREGFVLHLRGWAVGDESPAVSVEVLYEDTVIRTVPIRGSRPDLAAVAPSGADVVFHALVGVLGLTPEFELELQAVLSSDARAPIGTVKARHSPPQPEGEPRLNAITVTCLGRSGTTWLMKALADHPQIVVFRRPPYESAPAKYWLHMLKVLSEPGNVVETGYRHDFHEDLASIRPNPFYDDGIDDLGELGQWFASEYIERLAAFCRKNIDDWYLTVARRQDQYQALYFAEKHMWPNYLPVLTRELYPKGKEIFLVRDFRDMASSILAFDEQRGYTGFRRPDGVTDEQYLRGSLRDAALGLTRSWRSRRDTGHLVRYEDLARRPEATFASLLEYLELDASQDAVAALLAEGSEEAPALQGHKTSSSLDASIGRWQQERDESFRKACNEAFAEALEEFGYA